MMNESIHSVVDCSNQVLLLLGISALRGQSALHQFGEGRAKYFLVQLLQRFLVGGALGVMEAIQKLLHPSHEVENVAIVIGILILVCLWKVARCV